MSNITRWALGLSVWTLMTFPVLAGDNDFLTEDQIPKDAVPLPLNTFHFDREVSGKAPPLFVFPVSGKGGAARWTVIAAPDAPSRPHVLAQSSPLAQGDNTAFALLPEVSRPQGEIAVRFKTLSTDDEQVSGLVYFYENDQNHYLLATNTRSDSCTLFRVKNGKRKTLATMDTLIAPLRWHEVRIAFTPETYSVVVDKQLVMGGRYKNAPMGGQVGLFVASNSKVVFDDFQVSK